VGRDESLARDEAGGEPTRESARDDAGPGAGDVGDRPAAGRLAADPLAGDPLAAGDLLDADPLADADPLVVDPFADPFAADPLVVDPFVDDEALVDDDALVVDDPLAGDFTAGAALALVAAPVPGFALFESASIPVVPILVTIGRGPDSALEPAAGALPGAARSTALSRSAVASGVTELALSVRSPDCALERAAIAKPPATPPTTTSVATTAANSLRRLGSPRPRSASRSAIAGYRSSASYDRPRITMLRSHFGTCCQRGSSAVAVRDPSKPSRSATQKLD